MTTIFVTLDSWMTVEQAAKVLGVSATRVRQMIEERRHFRRVAAVGDRPQYLLPRTEVETMAKGAAERAAKRAADLAAARAPTKPERRRRPKST